jgi:hypothetical protein
VEVSGEQLAQLEDPSKVKVAGAAKLDPARIYRLVTTDFLATTWTDRGFKLRVTDQGVLLRDLTIDWIKEKKVIP